MFIYCFNDFLIKIKEYLNGHFKFLYDNKKHKRRYQRVYLTFTKQHSTTKLNFFFKPPLINSSVANLNIMG